jgi:hypothetical protein
MRRQPRAEESETQSGRVALKGQVGMITRHKINARVVLFDEAEVAAFIESARVG